MGTGAGSRESKYGNRGQALAGQQVLGDQRGKDLEGCFGECDGGPGRVYEVS